jgi:transcriptional regulator with XRE-family HTH domain
MTKLINQTIGQRIKFVRKMRNFSQQKLGEKIGVSFQQIQKYESGDDNISVARLNQIARALRVSVVELMGHKKNAISTSVEENKYLVKLIKYFNKLESIALKDKVVELVRGLG